MHKVLNKESVFKGKVFEAVVEDIELDNGKRLNGREAVIHRGGCSVVAIKDFDSDNPKVILVKQYRHTVADYILEIPAGIIEPNENPKDGAIRELQEETGYFVNPNRPVVDLLMFYKSPGYTTEKHYIYLCEVLDNPGTTNFDPDEDIEVVILSVEEAVHMIFDGKIIDSKAIAGILAYREKYCRK